MSADQHPTGPDAVARAAAGAAGVPGPGDPDHKRISRVGRPDTDEAETLRAALGKAEHAASAAYRDTARLIRLLTVIGTPLPPAQLIERTLMVLSEVFAADVVGVAEALEERLLVSTCCGLPADDLAFTLGFGIGPVAREVIRTGTPTERGRADDADLPPALRGAGNVSAAWIPLSGGSELAGDLLVLYRRNGDPFSTADLHVLLSLAYRMYSAVEASERGAAIERLAQAGPGLAQHLDLESLLDDAVVLMRELTGTEAAWIATVHDGVTDLVAETGARAPVPVRGSAPPADAVPVEGARPATMPGSRRWRVPTADLAGWSRLSTGEPYVGPVDGDQTYLLVPVTRDDTVLAVLGAHGRRTRSFGKTAVEVATVLANYLSVAITNGELYRALKAHERELHRRANRDPLTGLANRTLASQRIEEALATSPTGAVGLLFFDMDKFKAVNDRLGHEAGDELIQQVALRLRKTVRPGDLLARFGGDEFVLLVNGVSDLGDVTDMGRRIQLSLADPILLRGERIPVSASIGAVLGRRETATASAMLRDSDAAMYVAKAKGTGRLEVFDDDASHRSVDRLDLRSELSHALERDELSVVYQPLVELKSNTIRSFEALARWTHPERGPVPPDVFIPMAEETGAIVPIGAWVLARACDHLAVCQRARPDAHLTMSVNISAIQLEDSNLSLLQVIRESGVDPSDVWLEVTEHMDTPEDITRQVSELREAGVHFSLDDFGMSYSSLTYLQRFPVEGIKIDRSFVAAMNNDETHRGIVRAILAVAESLSVDVVAEGIESREQLDSLLDLGCGVGQGYLLGRPASDRECTDALCRQS